MHLWKWTLQKERIVLVLLPVVTAISFWIATYFDRPDSVQLNVPATRILTPSSKEATTSSFHVHHWTLQHETSSFVSSVHCVGDNFASDAWKYRSCVIRNLCCDTTTHEWFVVPSPAERRLVEWLALHFPQDSRIALSTLSSTSVALGKVQLGNGTLQHVQWSPRVRPMAEPSYYWLAIDSVWIPQYVSHVDSVLWDVVFPMYILVSSFRLDHAIPFITLIPGPTQDILDSIRTYAPLFGIDPFAWTTLDALPLASARSSSPMQSPLVCAAHAVVGTPPWHTRSDNIDTYLVGRGYWVDGFRTYLLQHMGIQEPVSSPLTPVTVTWLCDPNDSSTDARIHQFVSGFLPSIVQVHELVLQPDVSLANAAFRKQVDMMLQTNILVTTSCSERASLLALFLPPQSSLVVQCPTTQPSLRSQWHWHKERGTIRVYNHSGGNETFQVSQQLHQLVAYMVDDTTVE
jgi:hypothetical protein